MGPIRLELLSESHLEPLQALVDDPDVQRFTRVPAPPPPGFPRTLVRGYTEGRRRGKREGFAILDRADGAFLGIAVVPRIEPEARTAELGYVVVPEARGRGVATAALRFLTNWGFATLEAERLELLISVDNEASKRVAARCGYQLEGVLRSLYIKPGLRGDTELWSRLPGDPS
jgi:RimJ/RimL family protein N-acetyltransferase